MTHRLFFPELTSRHTANVIGIDPGTRFMGVAVLTYDLRTSEIVKTSARTLLAEQMRLDLDMADVHGAKFARLSAIEHELGETFAEVGPIDVYCESPYYSGKTPSAFGPLIETVQTVRRAVVHYDRIMGLSMITPSAIKAAIGVSGSAKKEPVMNAMRLLAREIFFEGDFERLDNNAIDALAIAVTGYKQSIGLI